MPACSLQEWRLICSLNSSWCPCPQQSEIPTEALKPTYDPLHKVRQLLPSISSTWLHYKIFIYFNLSGLTHHQWRSQTKDTQTANVIPPLIHNFPVRAKWALRLRPNLDPHFHVEMCGNTHSTSQHMQITFLWLFCKNWFSLLYFVHCGNQKWEQIQKDQQIKTFCTKITRRITTLTQITLHFPSTCSDYWPDCRDIGQSGRGLADGGPAAGRSWKTFPPVRGQLLLRLHQASLQRWPSISAPLPAAGPDWRPRHCLFRHNELVVAFGDTCKPRGKVLNCYMELYFSVQLQWDWKH